MKNNIAIAIDGPAAAGKSTVAKIVAKKLSFIYIDTGAMYRALALEALTERIHADDEHALVTLLKNINIELNLDNHNQQVIVNGKDVTLDIRSQKVTQLVSHIAKHPLVRKEMVKRQQNLARQQNVVMDGRDIGTHVLPKAQLKFFLIASVEERAKRRHEENIQKGFATNLEEIKQDILERDRLDEKRTFAPLKKAKDAKVIDTTSKGIDEVVDEMISHIKMIKQ